MCMKWSWWVRCVFKEIQKDHMYQNMKPEGWKVFKSLVTIYYATISIFLKCLRLH